VILADEEIAKARARAAAAPQLATLAETHADKTPVDLAGPKDLQDRLRFASSVIRPATRARRFKGLERVAGAKVEPRSLDAL